MLFSARQLSGMGAPPVKALQPVSRHLSQWSKTAILSISRNEDDEVKKSPPDTNGTSGFIIGGDATARVAHLEHSVRFLQEQHRLMLNGLHTEIEALRERNRDLQFQLIFNKEASPKPTSPSEEGGENNEREVNLKREVSRLEREAAVARGEAAAARGEARAAEARALQLQRLVDAQAEKLRELDIRKCSTCQGAESEPEGSGTTGSSAGAVEASRAELRARLTEAERLVRRLRGDAERQRREVLAAAAGGAVTNLLFDGAAARHAHLQCMKNSLHASLRASGLDGGYGYQNNYHFPPVHTPEFWREPLREDFNMVAGRGRSTRRPLTLPELSGQQIHRSTVYANNHTRPRANGYDHKSKKGQAANGDPVNAKTPEEPAPSRHKICTNDVARMLERRRMDRMGIYPELKVVVTKMIPHEKASTTAESSRARRKHHHHRKHAPDHT